MYQFLPTFNKEFKIALLLDLFNNYKVPSIPINIEETNAFLFLTKEYQYLISNSELILPSFQINSSITHTILLNDNLCIIATQDLTTVLEIICYRVSPYPLLDTLSKVYNYHYKKLGINKEETQDRGPISWTHNDK